MKKNTQWAKKTHKAPNRFLDKWPNRHISVKFDKKTRKQPLFRCYHFGFDVAAIASYQYRIRARHLYRKMAARFNIIFRISYSVQLRPPCTNVATVATNEIRLYRLRTINQCERRVETTEIEWKEKKLNVAHLTPHQQKNRTDDDNHFGISWLHFATDSLFCLFPSCLILFLLLNMLWASAACTDRGRDSYQTLPITPLDIHI